MVELVHLDPPLGGPAEVADVVEHLRHAPRRERRPALRSRSVSTWGLLRELGPDQRPGLAAERPGRPRTPCHTGSTPVSACCRPWPRRTIFGLLNRYRNAAHDFLRHAPSPPRPTPLAGRTAAVAVTLMFVVNGMLLGGFGGALPSLRDKLDIEASQIARDAVPAPARRGSPRCRSAAGWPTPSAPARVTLVGLPVLIAGAVVIGLAPTYPVAVVGGVLIGFGNGALDVAMNAIGVQVEAARRRPIMSFFHAFWSVGNFVGAGAVLLLATALGITGGAIVTPLMITLAGCRRRRAGGADPDRPGGGGGRPQGGRRTHRDPAGGLDARHHGARASGCPRARPSTGPRCTSPTSPRSTPTTGLARPGRGQRLHGGHPAARRPAGRPLRPAGGGPLRRRLRRARLPHRHPGRAACRCCWSAGRWSASASG